MAWLYALDDAGEVISHKGDSGAMSMAIWEENGVIKYQQSKPRVGVCLRVGSMSARTFSSQDWWQTTEIKEIISEDVGKDGIEIKFMTNNSVYLWKE